MPITASSIRGSLRVHWFVLAALVIAAADLSLAILDDWSNPGLLEAGILFDLAIVIPALYLWCYRSRGRAAVVRAIALSCLGIWVAGHLVPDQHHRVLSTAGVFRYIGLAVLVVIELKLLAMFVRAIFRREGEIETTVFAAAKDADLPDWAARLMVWEASMWRKGWDALRRMVGRR